MYLEENSRPKKNIQNLELHLDDLEQYQRSNCLILHRSDIANNENYNEFLKELVNILNIKLKLTSTDVIQKQDIDIVHCLPASNRSRQDRAGTKFIPPIIIKFVCCSVQNHIYSSKSKLVGSGLFITESLTRKILHFLKVGSTRILSSKHMVLKRFNFCAY